MVSVKAETCVRHPLVRRFWSDFKSPVRSPGKPRKRQQHGYSDESTRAGTLLIKGRLVVGQDEKGHVPYSDGADGEFIRDRNPRVDLSSVHVSYLDRRLVFSQSEAFGF